MILESSSRILESSSRIPGFLKVVLDLTHHLSGTRHTVGSYAHARLVQVSFFAEPGGMEAMGYVARTQRTQTGGNACTTTCSMFGLFESECAGE